MEQFVVNHYKNGNQMRQRETSEALFYITKQIQYEQRQLTIDADVERICFENDLQVEPVFINDRENPSR